jgi:PAS domain S-box-containing protein
MRRRRLPRSARELTERQVRDIAEHMPHTVWVTDARGKNVYQNRAWYEYVGAPRGSSYNEDWLEFYHPDDRAYLMREWTLARQSNGEHAYDIEARIRRYDGVYRWFRIKGSPVRHARGKIVEWVGTCTDIDSQKRAQQDTLAAAVRLRRAVDVSGVGVFEWDLRSGQVLYQSERFFDILGHPREQEPRWSDGVLMRSISAESRRALKQALHSAPLGKPRLRLRAQLGSERRGQALVDIAGKLFRTAKEAPHS